MKDWTRFSVKEKIGQMIVVRASGYLFDHQIRYPAWEPVNEKLRNWLENFNIGGVILLGGSAPELAYRTQQLQNWATTPLLIAADIEEGVGQRFSGACWFPPPMCLSFIAKNNPNLAQFYASQMGAIIAKEALSIGINWLLAPVVDVNNNPANPVINVRSFGDNPELVGALASAFIEGAKKYPILTCAKHFPGHGDTATDSHLDLPVLPHSNERLQKIELPPFERAIVAGVDSIMSAHLKIPVWDNQDPATLSREILTGQLREKLGFEGLIVTDALIMGGVTKYASSVEIAVKAVAAGADILLMPDDPVVAIEAVYQAVKSGKISPERINESVERIFKLKEKVINSSKIDLNQLSQPEARKTIRSILKDSMEMGSNLPCQPLQGKNARNLIVVDDLLNCDFLGRQCPAVAIPKQLGYDLQLVEQNNLVFAAENDRVTGVGDLSRTLLQIFIRGNPFRGSAGLTEKSANFYQYLLKTELIQGLIIYGSPYILEWFRPLFSPQLPWVFSYGQMPMAQKIACQALLGVSEILKEGIEEFTD